MTTIILDNLIAEGESLTSTITYIPQGPGVLRTFSVYKSSLPDKYQDWLSSAQRFIKTHHPSDLEEFKLAAHDLFPDNHKTILGLLRAIKLLPDEPKSSEDKKSGTQNFHINNSSNQSNSQTNEQTNTQTNHQEIAVSLFLDAIKDELKGREVKEVAEILQDIENDPVGTKSKLIDKIKSFGGDVATNIVANILTNPAIYQGLF